MDAAAGRGDRPVVGLIWEQQPRSAGQRRPFDPSAPTGRNRATLVSSFGVTETIMSFMKNTRVRLSVLIGGLATLAACNMQPIGATQDTNAPDATNAPPDATDTSGATDAPGANRVVFADPDSDFSTSDVRDIDEEIVRFDPVANTLIWVADGSAFDGWEVNGNLLGAAGAFQVRFGTVGGERRAYFTETGPATICDITVANSRLSISPTSTPVPQ